jgi:hypothetical protein
MDVDYEWKNQWRWKIIALDADRMANQVENCQPIYGTCCDKAVK